MSLRELVLNKQRGEAAQKKDKLQQRTSTMGIPGLWFPPSEGASSYFLAFTRRIYSWPDGNVLKIALLSTKNLASRWNSFLDPVWKVLLFQHVLQAWRLEGHVLPCSERRGSSLPPVFYFRIWPNQQFWCWGASMQRWETNSWKDKTENVKSSSSSWMPAVHISPL